VNTKLKTSTNNLDHSTHTFCGPGSSVGIATGYGLDGPGIESTRSLRVHSWKRQVRSYQRIVLGVTKISSRYTKVENKLRWEGQSCLTL
jgi:hypothetical protein